MRQRDGLTLCGRKGYKRIMLASHPCSIAAIEDDYRIAAEALFPPTMPPEGEGMTYAAVENFACVLGVEAEFRRFASEGGTEAEEFRHFLAHFQKNLDLLISKTWVEKADEIRKEQLQRRLPILIDFIERRDYRAALEEFGIVLDELAYLFFGAQSLKEDFTEYALRIDTQIGLFWWYGIQIRTQNLRVDDNILRSLLLIGICYLTSF
jgi:hypothetical protein